MSSEFSAGSSSVGGHWICLLRLLSSLSLWLFTVTSDSAFSQVVLSVLVFARLALLGLRLEVRVVDTTNTRLGNVVIIALSLGLSLLLVALGVELINGGVAMSSAGLVNGGHVRRLVVLSRELVLPRSPHQLALKSLSPPQCLAFNAPQLAIFDPLLDLVAASHDGPDHESHVDRDDCHNEQQANHSSASFDRVFLRRIREHEHEDYYR